MKILEVLEEKGFDVFAVGPADTLGDVVKGMRRHAVGSMMVLNKTGSLVGIVTERDVVTAVVRYAAGAMRLLAEMVMTRDVITCCPEDSLESAQRAMERHQIRHVPVVDAGTVIGMVSVRDSLNAAMAQKNADVARLLLRARCRPHHPRVALAA